MTTAPAQPASARQGLLARQPLISFFVMAHAFTWIVWSPWVLGQDGAGLLPITISQCDLPRGAVSSAFPYMIGFGGWPSCSSS